MKCYKHSNARTRRLDNDIVTHELNFAKDVADRVILMENGQVVEQNTAANFFSRPQQERTKQFLLQAKNACRIKRLLYLIPD